VTLTVTAGDVCDLAPTCRIVSVSRDGGARRGAAGKPDAILVDPGPKPSPANLALLLRSEPVGLGVGGGFTIDVSCSDGSGNTVVGQQRITRDSNGRRSGARPTPSLRR